MEVTGKLVGLKRSEFKKSKPTAVRFARFEDKKIL